MLSGFAFSSSLAETAHKARLTSNKLSEFEPFVDLVNFQVLAGLRSARQVWLHVGRCCMVPVKTDIILKSTLISGRPVSQDGLAQENAAMSTATTQMLTADVPLDLFAKVDKLAVQFDRPRNWIVNQALMAWVDQEEAFDRLTLDALRDIDEGRVVDHEVVQAWVDSLGTDEPMAMPL